MSYARRSLYATETLEGEKRLEAKVITRWNSGLKSIRSILAVPQAKLEQLDCPHHLITTPFGEATYIVQSQNSTSSSLVIPCIRALRGQLQSHSVKYISKMVATLGASLERRMGSYEKRETYINATILDPRFKLMWCPPVEAEVLKAIFMKTVQQ